MHKPLLVGTFLLLPGLTLAQGVGIGTTQPDRPLAIQPPSGGYELLSLKNNTGATQWHLNLYYGGLNFVETNVADYRLLLQTGGNVGIGTGSPSQKVEVVGGSVFVNSENTGYLTDSQPNARVGLLKYGGREGGIWRLSTQDFEIGRVDASVTALPGSPSAWTTDLYVAADGKVGVGTATPAYTLDVAGTIRGANVSPSDVRFKTAVRPLSGALAAVLALRGVRYRWNALGVAHGGRAQTEQVGMLAQELEQVYPELVTTDAAGYKAINYAQLTPVLLEALKEQQQELEALRARLTTAEARVAEATTDHAALQTLQEQVAKLQKPTLPTAHAPH